LSIDDIRQFAGKHGEVLDISFQSTRGDRAFVVSTTLYK
jgi:hypothetical protein